MDGLLERIGAPLTDPERPLHRAGLPGIMLLELERRDLRRAAGRPAHRTGVTGRKGRAGGASVAQNVLSIARQEHHTQKS